MEVQKFRTKDIGLAVHLYCNETHLMGMVPNGNNKVTFVFKQPDQKLLDDWLAGDTRGDTKAAVLAYRHLMRDARMVIAESKETNKNGNFNKR